MQLLFAMSWISRLTGALCLCDPESIEQLLPMVEPVPRSWKEWHQRRDFEKILQQCWTNDNELEDNDGYAISLGEELMVNQQASSSLLLSNNNNIDISSSSTTSYRPSTYGEISTTGARQLFHAMKLTSSPSNIVFVDLGSGTGKLVVQAAWEIPALTKAIGWELAPSRHEAAMRALERGFSRIPQWNEIGISARIELHQGDLFEADLETATHIWVASLCFSPSMMERLEYKLAERFYRSSQSTKDPTSPATSPILQCVASLQRFPGTLLGPPEVTYMQMSWYQPRGSAVYLYRGPKGHSAENIQQ